MNRTLAVQIAVVAACIGAVALLAVNFPAPSPLIKPLLPPMQRWPQAQIEAAVESGDFDRGFLHFFARDPQRVTPAGNNMVSPSDGVVQAIRTRDGIAYLTVGLSFWDVHVVRTPVAGVVKSIEPEGYYLTRRLAEGELDENIFLRGKAAPVQEIVTLDTSQGEIRVRLITSYWASRLKIWVHVGQKLAKGERIGRILLGSTVVTEMPANIAVTVKEGQRVVGGETIVWSGGDAP